MIRATLNSFLLSYLRHFPVDHGKIFFERALRLDHLPKSFVHTNSRTGIRFELDMSDRGDLLLYLYNSVERNTERHFRSRLSSMSSDLVFFDCGANIGFYSLLVRSLLPNAVIHAFEPLPQAFDRLENNIMLNNFNGIHTVPAALSDKEGRATLFVGGQASAASIIHTPGKDLSFDVEMTTIDSYCERHGVSRVDVIKIDTEGCEQAVIRGAAKTLEQNPEILLVVEMMQNSSRANRYSTSELFAKLLTLGFKAFLPSGWPFGLQRIEACPADYLDNLFFLRANA